MSYEVMAGLVGTAILMGIGVPILVALGLGTIYLMWVCNYPLLVVGQVPFSGIDKFAFLAVPLFILTGDIIAHSGMARQLVRLAYAMFGWIQGGLGASTLIGSGFFAAISGSNSATAAAMGRMMIPEMESKYTRDYSGAIVACGACMGIIIPPSIIYIIYGSVAGVSVGALFIAGILPGILMIAFMCVANYFMCKVHRYDPPVQKFSASELLKAIWDAKFALIAPIIILGSIYGGIATPTESAVIAVAYCLIVSFLRKKMKVSDMSGLFLRSGVVCGVLMPIVALATLFSETITMLRIPSLFTNAILGISESEIIIMFSLFLILFIAGMVMDTTPIILILVPLIGPIVTNLGLDPVHWGIAMITTLTIGFVTPPIGINLYVVSSIAKIPIVTLFVKSIPLIIAMLLALFFIYVFPQLSLWLVQFIL
ncbi:MAG: TRAP transporter large permease [Bacillota bacterium]